MLPADEIQALAARARVVARAVVGLVLTEELTARFVHAYSREYHRPGISGEAEHKADYLAAVERESLLLVASRIERTLPRVVASRWSRPSQNEVAARFREAFLTFLGGSLAWDNDERAAFRKDLGIYLRLANRQDRAPAVRRGEEPAGGVFIDRCAFLVDPSMLAQAREAAAGYQAELIRCADQAVRAAFRGLRARPSPSRQSRRAPGARSGARGPSRGRKRRSKNRTRRRSARRHRK